MKICRDSSNSHSNSNSLHSTPMLSLTSHSESNHNYKTKPWYEISIESRVKDYKIGNQVHHFHPKVPSMSEVNAYRHPPSQNKILDRIREVRMKHWKELN